MKRYFSLVLDTAHSVALSLWLGGLVVVVAVLPSSAGRVDAQAGLGSIVEMAGLTVVGVQWLLRRRYQYHRSRFVADGVRQLLTFAAFFAAEYVRYGVLTRGAVSAIGVDRLASACRIADAVQIAVLVVIAALTAWLVAPRVAAPTSAASVR